MRVRGLKLNDIHTVGYTDEVAPRAGAWIETHEIISAGHGLAVAPRAGAWIETNSWTLGSCVAKSHPVRVRGLKQMWVMDVTNGLMSHPVRVRGLKLIVS
mgnify:CR=1 FL=1